MPEAVWYLVDGATGRVVSHLAAATPPVLGGWPDRYVIDPSPSADELATYRAWLEAEL